MVELIVSELDSKLTLLELAVGELRVSLRRARDELSIFELA